MRQNLFLHFLNRDTREIFDIYRMFKEPDHASQMRKALNACVILCEDKCILPPGFVIEDTIAFELAENQNAYLSESLLQFPMRESSLTEYAEKKRSEYSPMRSRYSGLFDDSRLEFLGQNTEGLIRRKTHITEKILKGWSAGVDTGSPVWKPVRTLLQTTDIETVRAIPGVLADNDTALTWSAIAPQLPAGATPAKSVLRSALQHTYFKQYCLEFDLIILTAIPHMIDDFSLPRHPNSYSFKRFAQFLDVFGLRDFALLSSADVIVQLRRRAGFIEFIDAYVALAESAESETELKYRADQAFRDVRFDWSGFARRNHPLIAPPGELELVELIGAMQEAAGLLTRRYGLQSRAAVIRNGGLPGNQSPTSSHTLLAGKEAVNMLDKMKPQKKSGPIVISTGEPKIVLFVALEEELDVLCKQWGFKKNATSPAAGGQLGDLAIDILCPKEMGRVAAAVEVSRYLAQRRNDLPKLMVILGLAGGFEENGTKKGHILCGTTVVDLANRKVTDDNEGLNTNFRRHDYALEEALWNVLTSQEFDSDAWIKEAIEISEWPADRRPALYKGLVMSGDEVVSSDEWRRTLIHHGGKLLGVEMEAGGVCAAAAKFKVPVSMLRAVSDQADPSKADDSWRKIGMKTLGLLMSHLNLGEVLNVISH